MNDRIRHYLEEARYRAEWRASHDPDCNCDGYFTGKMVRDEIKRPPFKLNPEVEQVHSDAFRDQMRDCFSAAAKALELQELLTSET